MMEENIDEEFLIRANINYLTLMLKNNKGNQHEKEYREKLNQEYEKLNKL